MYKTSKDIQGESISRLPIKSFLQLAVVFAALFTVVFAFAGCASSSTTSSVSSVSSSSAATVSSSASASSSSSSSQAAQANDMTIVVSMKEKVTQPTDVDSPLQFAEEQINVVAPLGANALEVLKATQREIETEGTGNDEMVVAIGGLSNGSAGNDSHWEYEVDGQPQTENPTECILQDGQTLTWVFVH